MEKMKRIEMVVNKEAAKVISEVILHLNKISADESSRLIRIGGSEFRYDGGVCEIESVFIDDVDVNVSGQPTTIITGQTSVTVTNDTCHSNTNYDDNNEEHNGDDSQSKSNLEIDVDIIITDLCDGEGLFTAYDITRELRAEGKKCRHSDVRNIVHNTYTSGEMLYDYTRSLIFVGHNHQAFVYHPKDVDPNVYNGDNTDDSVSGTDPLNDLD